MLKRYSITEKTVIYLLLTIAFVALLFSLYFINDKYFLVNIPKSGGEIVEGSVGFTSLINPVFAKTQQEKDLVYLTYSALLKKDISGTLVNDLAKDWIVNEDNTIFLFTLRSDIKFHDGIRLKAEDVVYTINLIKKHVDSPLHEKWINVEVEVESEDIIRFRLKSPSALFTQQLDFGVLPSHIWNKIAPEDVKRHWSNKSPIGSGPYKIDSFESSSDGVPLVYNLKIFENYYNKLPHIEKITFKFYNSEKEMITALTEGKINSVQGLSTKTLEGLDLSNYNLNVFKTNRIFTIFLDKDGNDELFSDPLIRSTLSQCLDREKISDYFGKKAIPVSTPIQVENTIKKFECKTESISQSLQEQGWKYNSLDQVREKDGSTASFSLLTIDQEEFVSVANILVEEWKKIGIRANIVQLPLEEVKEKIRTKEFSAVLYAYDVGKGNNIYNSWHSEGKNNIIQYENEVVDLLIERVFDVSDDNVKKLLYNEINEEILKDSPAIFLYSPNFLYLTSKFVKNINIDANLLIDDRKERYIDIENWFISEEEVWNIFN